MNLWRDRPAEVTLILTLLLCGVGFVMGVEPMQLVGVLLFGLVLTAINSIKRRERP
jgi:hypothetical protein